MGAAVARTHNKRISGAARFLSVVVLLGLAGCGDKPVAAGPQIDLVAEPLPFARPVIAPVTSLPGAPPLPAAVSSTLDLQRAFFAGDFARLDAALIKAHDEFVAGSGDVSPADTFVDRIQDTQLAGVDVCADWLKARPDSYPAHWVCGAMWESGAQAARGTAYANEVSDARFVLMHERQARSDALLQRALTLTAKPFEVLTILAVNQYRGGDRAQAEAYLQRAEQFKPQYLPIHEARLNYTLPEWGGTPDALHAALDRAKRGGVSESALLDLEDGYIARPSKMSNPGAARAYWEAAISTQATRKRLSRLMNDFVWLKNWHDALPVADRLIDDYPENTAAYYQRARIHESLGRMPEARADYRMATAMGHDVALQTLIMAHIRGGLGLPGKSFTEVDDLCRYGAGLGSSVGANCLGSLFFEAGDAGVPRKQDLPQSLAWHLVGARAGHYNSQYDLGWLLFTGRGQGVAPASAQRIGTFWLRRAAEQNHVFAKRKLEEAGISLSEETAWTLDMSLESIRLVMQGIVDGILEQFRRLTRSV